MSQDTKVRLRANRPPGLEADVAAFRLAAIRDRWSVGLMAIGWVHLATFLTSYSMYQSGELAAPRYLVIWLVEALVVAFLIRRMVTNNGRHQPPPLVGLLARVWLTFLILAFSVSATNNLMGMPPEWFKPVWGTLSTFGFAMMAWIVSPWFLVPAVQMSLTSALIARWTPHAYLIYALSWWLALHLVAFAVERIRHAAILRGELEPAPASRRPSNRRYARSAEPADAEVANPAMTS